MFIVRIILLHSIIYSVFGKPRIIFSENRNIPTGSNLRIQCIGIFPLQWNTTHTDRGKIINAVHKNESLFESTFEIAQTIYTDTGEYNCSYQENAELKKNCKNGNITKEKCEEYSDKTNSIYIFVNDPEFIFLPINGVIFMIENEKHVIPCRVTSSHLNVSLWRKKAYVPMDTDIPYDPTKGFIVKRLTDFFSGLFSCKVEFQNKLHEISIHLDYEPNRSYSITDISVLEVPVGSPVELICSFYNNFRGYWRIPKTGWSAKIEFSKKSAIRRTRPGLIQGGSETIRIIETLYNNTGYYICSNNRKNYDLDEVNNSITYMFVNDPNNLFAPIENVQPVYTCIRNVIPCFPTFSTLNVSLWLGSEQLPIGDGIMFEKTRGFILDYPTSYNNETFTCKAKYGNNSQTIDTHILTFDVVTDLKIIATKRSPEKGEELNLTCIGCSYHYKEMKWLWRRFGENESYLITDSSELGVSVLSNTSSSHTRVKILKFSSLSSNNNGVYTCIGAARKDNASNIRSQFYLRIKDTETPIIKFIYTNMNGGIIRVSPGEELSLVCEVKGFPQPNVTWYKDGRIYDIETSRQKTLNIFHPLYDYSNRIVYSAVYNDSGIYKCLAENSAGILERNVTVDIIKNILRKILPPKINKESYVDIKSGSKIMIQCEGEDVLEWIWPDKRVPQLTSQFYSCRRYIVEKRKHVLSIEITSVNKENAGYYICCYIGRDCDAEQNKASTYIFVTETNSSNIMIPEYIPPVYRCISNAILCRPTNSEVNIELLRNSKVIPVGNSISFDKTRGFILNDRRVSANTNYTCRPKNSFWMFETSIKNFDVTPDILLYATDENPIEQDEVSIVCNACNYHYSDIIWFWRGKGDEKEREITNNNELGIRILSNNTIHEIENQLQFDNISLINSGIYKCLVYSKLRSVINRRKQIEIIVRDIQKATIVQTNLNGTLEISFGYPKELFCDVVGVPTPVIRWYKDEELLIESDELKVNRGNLTINRFSEKYAGTYKCIAENEGGSDSASIILKIKKETSFFLFKITVIVVPITLLIIFAIGYLILKRRILKQRDEQWMDIFTEMFSVRDNPTPFNPNIPLEEQTESLPYDPKWEFPIERMNIGKVLGVGTYGKVLEAEAIGIEPGRDISTVAVKTLKERADVLQFKSLLAELKILIYIGNHINIVNLLGAVTKNVSKGQLMIIMEYCCFGNIRQYLIRRQKKFINQLDPETDTVDPSICSLEDSIKINKTDNVMGHCKTIVYSTHIRSIDCGIDTFTEDSGCNKETSSNNDSFFNVSSNTEAKNVFAEQKLSEANMMEDEFVSTWDLLSFAYQTACGMEYLASRKLVHRDLAARNVLLAENNIIKICDFGLTKNSYDYAEALKKSNDPLPIRWLAIESLRDRIFSSKSDVWSFGVFLWELFSLGTNPYPGIEVNIEFYTMLKNGYRMAKPDYAPRNIYEIMLNCWNNDPELRPGFSELIENLKNSLSTSTNRYYIKLDLYQFPEEDNESSQTSQSITETNENICVHL